MLRRYHTLMAATGGMLASGLINAGTPATVIHTPAFGLDRTATGWTSTNWSGYAGTGSDFTQVSADWTVPKVTKTKGNTYSSTWIGIDGFGNSDLIQTGTEQDWVGGKAHYDAWWEILPAPETVITGMTVKPGDKMEADIFYAGGPDWWISLEDVTELEPFSILQPYSGPQASVEWIQEATQINGKIATEAHYSLYDFTNAEFDTNTTNDGTGEDIEFQAGNRGVMIQKNKQVSTPSLAQMNNMFAMKYGAKTPPPPK
jgi:hypothetical protein